jgi:ankyrin repeat protein
MKSPARSPVSGPATDRTLAEVRVSYEFDLNHPIFTRPAVRDVDGDTLLHRPAFRGSERDVSDLIAMGCDINAHGDLGHTPLHLAAMRGHHSIVEILLAAGANHAALNEWGQTPGDTAATGGHKTLALLLKSARRRRRAQ